MLHLQGKTYALNRLNVAGDRHDEWVVGKSESTIICGRPCDESPMKLEEPKERRVRGGFDIAESGK